MADRDPNHLHPSVRAVMAEHLRRGGRYLRVGCVETYRDEFAQAVEWRKGRDENGNVVDPGAVVTNARPGASYHGLLLPDGTPCSLAYHVAIYRDDGSIPGYGSVLTPAEEALITCVGLLGEGLGMTWGGRWTRKDWYHFERRIPGMDLAAIRAALNSGRNILTA